MIDKEIFYRFINEFPTRVVWALDREDGKNKVIFFEIDNKIKLNNVKFTSTQLLIDNCRDGATLGVYDINSYEDFIKYDKKYERWKD